MSYRDWRSSDDVLLEDILARLAKLGFEVINHDDHPLHAIRRLKRNPPHDYTIILGFPETYPRHDIRAHIQSQTLVKEWIGRPIKHLQPPLMPFFREDWATRGILEVCLRGAWNPRDFTRPEDVYESVDEWVRDFALGEDFPDDFDLPEATFFFPTSEEQFFVDSYFLQQPFVRPGSMSFGNFKLLLGGNPPIGVLTSVIDFASASETGSALTVPRQYDLPGGDKICRNLMVNQDSAPVLAVQGFWQWSDVPPSRLAMGQSLVRLSPELEKLAKAKLIKPQAGMFLVAFFFMIYGRPACIFLVSKEKHASLEDTFKSPTYIKPHIISDTELYARHGRSIRLDRLKESKFTILGAGALGSQVGMALARMGFRQFVVVDPQCLSVGNVMRHSAFLSDAGRKKVDVVAGQIGTVSPYADVLTIDEDVAAIGFEFSRFANSVVVSTIADDRAELYLNQKLCEMGLTAVYGRTTTTSYACRVIRVRPGKDACLKCLSYYARFKDHRYVQLEDEEISREDLMFQGCTAPSFLGANLDIGTYANLIARVGFLETGAGESKFHAALEANHFIFGSRVVREEPKVSDPFRLQREFFYPLPGCTHCGNRDYPYACVVVSQEALEKMKSLALRSGPIETGGVLVGCDAELDGRRHALVIVHATQPGPGAIRRPVMFDRDKSYCTFLVHQYHSMTKGSLNYVGEWHSHPTDDTRPSPLDNASLYEVVNNPSYRMANPISIIQSASSAGEVRATVYGAGGLRYDERLIVSPFAELKRLFPALVEDLDPFPQTGPPTSEQAGYSNKENSKWQTMKKSLHSIWKQLWTLS